MVTSVSQSSVSLSWEAIEYTDDDGRYRIWYSTALGGPYSDGGTTPNKSTTSLTVNGLVQGTTYYFLVQSETDSHSSNQTKLISEYSDEISAETKREELIFRDGFEE